MIKVYKQSSLQPIFTQIKIRQLNSIKKHVLNFFASIQSNVNTLPIDNVDDEGPMKNTNKSKKKITKISFDASIEVHLRKPRWPNWEHGEILAFIKAKKERHITSLNKMDPRDQFETMVTKWK
jgi:hypothetical protein